MDEAIKMVGYLRTSCKYRKEDAVSYAAQYFGIREAKLYKLVA